MHLRAKLLCLLIPCVSAPLLAVGWLGFAQLRHSQEGQAGDAAQALLGQIADRAVAYRAAVEADVTLFAAAPRVRNYLLVEDERDRYELYLEGLLELFATYHKSRPDYYEIRLLLPDGYEDVRATPTPLPNATDEEGDTAFFRMLQASRGEPVVTLASNPDNGEPAIYVGRPIVVADTSSFGSSAPNVLRGYLVVTSRLSFMSETSREQAGQIQVFFTDERGNPWTRASQRKGNHPTREALRAAMASPGQVLRVALGDRSHLLLGRQVAQDLRAFVAVPTDELDAVGRRMAALVTLVTVAAIVLTAALLYRTLAGLLLEPLRRLGAAASALGRGETVEEIGIRSSDEIGELAARFEEMSENLRRSGEQARFLAHHDTLTGLPNRRRFTDQLEQALTLARSNATSFALLFIDIDDFKRVNDTLGHQAGDELLVGIAERMRAAIRGCDRVARTGEDGAHGIARLGGDEFIVLLPELVEPAHVGTVASRLLGMVSRPFNLRGHEFHVGASIGITFYPRDGETVDELVRNGDVAMYHAKSRGKRNYQFFDSSMNEATAERHSVEIALRQAIVNDELVLHYQPQFDITTGRIAAFEALVRWQHPERGLLLPGSFIQVAEQTGLIEPLGAWVLAEACRQAGRFARARAPDIRICVNVSHIQFKRPDFQSMVETILRDGGADPRQIELELTETSVMDSEERSAEILNGLKALGMSVSMDDFGTGYSSLAALRRLPIDTLKIDRSFVRDIVDDADDAAIVAAVLSMGHTLGLQVVAEGVEVPEQLEWLRAANCDLAQGFLLGRPMPAARAESLLDAHHGPQDCVASLG